MFRMIRRVLERISAEPFLILKGTERSFNPNRFRFRKKAGMQVRNMTIFGNIPRYALLPPKSFFAGNPFELESVFILAILFPEIKFVSSGSGVWLLKNTTAAVIAAK
ncbi:hypothetical protein CH375_05985 [Leptospira ellisii]|nr:hypothetical protein CH375_05985 [Leptospira ellisii]